MQSLGVWVACLVLFSSSVTGLPVCGEHNEVISQGDFFISADDLPFQDEFEEMFRNFSETDPTHVEKFSQLLNNISPFIDLDESNRMDVENANRINFVVSFDITKRIECGGC